MNIELSNTDTLDTIATRLASAQKAAKKAHIAKNGHPFGHAFICSTEDAYDDAMKWQGQMERAKAAGVHINVIEIQDVRQKELQSAIDLLRNIAENGETNTERSIREGAILSTIEGQQDGFKRKCSHKTTKKQHGWSFDARGVNYLTCWRCGAQSPSLKREEAPTAQALAAQTVLDVAFEHKWFQLDENTQIELIKRTYRTQSGTFLRW